MFETNFSLKSFFQLSEEKKCLKSLLKAHEEEDTLYVEVAGKE